MASNISKMKSCYKEIKTFKVLSMLHHPNIIEYYDSFLHDKSMMIVMEYAAGGTLFDLVESRAADQVSISLTFYVQLLCS